MTRRPGRLNLLGANQVQVRESIGRTSAAGAASCARTPKISWSGNPRFRNGGNPVQAALTATCAGRCTQRRAARSTLMNMGIEAVLAPAVMVARSAGAPRMPNCKAKTTFPPPALEQIGSPELAAR